jgi:CHAD domain-containing protein
MAGSHVEEETTLVWPGPTEAGSLEEALARVEGVARVVDAGTADLVAGYHDTTDLALLRGRLTLRRRAGGTDEGWHLKLPLEAGDDRRLEVQEPLDGPGPTPPTALVRLTRSRHRDRPLVAVATLRTRRRTLRLLGDDDTVLAEVADDAVEATVDPAVAGPDGPADLSWQEVEVELVDGDEDLLARATAALEHIGGSRSPYRSKLDHALTEAGAATSGPDPDEPGGAGGVVVGAVREHVAALVAADPMVRLDQPDAVHTMRVAARRIRSLLAAFRPLLTPGSGEPLREELRWLGEVLGGPRDAEVLTERLAQRVGELPPGTASSADPLAQVDRVSRADGDVAEDAVACLDGARYLRLLADLDLLLADPPLADEVGRRRGTRRAARRAYRRLHRDLAEVPAEEGEDRDAALHEARKAAKRLRYTCEAVVGVHGRRARRLAARAEDLQELLGDHQDSVGARALLGRAAEQARQTGEDTFALGVLVGLEHAAARTGLLGLDRATRRLDRAADRWFD